MVICHCENCAWNFSGGLEPVEWAGVFKAQLDHTISTGHHEYKMLIHVRTEEGG